MHAYIRQRYTMPILYKSRKLFFVFCLCTENDEIDIHMIIAIDILLSNLHIIINLLNVLLETILIEIAAEDMN